MTTKKNEATAQPTAQATAMTAPPETMEIGELLDYGDDEGKGHENQDLADLKIPMIVVLQANSPQVVEGKGKVHAGQLMNTVTGEIRDAFYFVPAITDHCFLAFVPRDDGGGFRGRYAKDSKVVMDAIARNDGRAIGKLPFPQPKDPKTNKDQPTQELVENFEVYSAIYDPEQQNEVIGFAVIPFTSTKIKTYRGWNSAITNFRPKVKGRAVDVPLFAHTVKMTSAVEKNAKGTYFVSVLEPAKGGDDLKNSLIAKTDLRYMAAKKLHDQVLAGVAKGAYETMEQDAGPDPEGGVPF